MQGLAAHVVLRAVARLRGRDDPGGGFEEQRVVPVEAACAVHAQCAERAVRGADGDPDRRVLTHALQLQPVLDDRLVREIQQARRQGRLRVAFRPAFSAGDPRPGSLPRASVSATRAASRPVTTTPAACPTSSSVAAPTSPRWASRLSASWRATCWCRVGDVVELREDVERAPAVVPNDRAGHRHPTEMPARTYNSRLMADAAVRAAGALLFPVGLVKLPVVGMRGLGVRADQVVARTPVSLRRRFERRAASSRRRRGARSRTARCRPHVLLALAELLGQKAHQPARGDQGPESCQPGEVLVPGRRHPLNGQRDRVRGSHGNDLEHRLRAAEEGNAYRVAQR